MPRWIGDNIKGSEYAKLRTKVCSGFMVGVVALGYVLFRYGAPTQKKAIKEGWYNEDSDYVARKAHMRYQMQTLPVKRFERRDIDSHQEYLGKLESQDRPIIEFGTSKK